MPSRFSNVAAFALVSFLASQGIALGEAATNSPLDPGPSTLPHYRVTRWTSENGLPQSSIMALVQSRDGYLWIGTLKGLVRFDGVKFKVFDHNNTPEMTHD